MHNNNIVLAFILDWVPAAAIAAMGFFTTPLQVYTDTKEVLIILGVLLGIATNVVRLYKLFKKDKED